MPGPSRREVIKAFDRSARLITLTASLTLVEGVHSGVILLMGAAGAELTFTLPAARGSGATYRFMVSVVNTSNYIVEVANANDTIDGSVYITDAGASNNVLGFAAASTSDTITFTGTDQGGVAIGDWFEVTDIAVNQWACSGNLSGSGGSVTSPWSADVS